jgi:hypothetical protein
LTNAFNTAESMKLTRQVDLDAGRAGDRAQQDVP